MPAQRPTQPPRRAREQRPVARCFDASASLAGLLLLSPLLAAIAVAIKLSDGGPVFYRQRRIGRGFRPFFVYKFRTMMAEADRLGAGITAAGDPRVTPLGRTLRRYKLDELPQLWNVVRGDMALVGPRPEVPEFVESFRALYGPLLTVRPGLTDPGTIAFSNEEELLSGPHSLEMYAEEVLPRKLGLSLEYCKRRTWKSDLGVLFRTLQNVLLSPRAKAAAMGRSLLAGQVETPLRRQVP
jgi:lipopolysaccharide/colanic/teichoic acid biosynthesis glycosyltransferase